mmetsp:Transcript_345/g.1011  ORF Transcript_345/g.1011 Transcript_345/m.1011 type:complete len:242 (+) Transcript_345:261-986(+)
MKFAQPHTARRPLTNHAKGIAHVRAVIAPVAVVEEQHLLVRDSGVAMEQSEMTRLPRGQFAGPADPIESEHVAERQSRHDLDPLQARVGVARLQRRRRGREEYTLVLRIDSELPQREAGTLIETDGIPPARHLHPHDADLPPGGGRVQVPRNGYVRITRELVHLGVPKAVVEVEDDHGREVARGPLARDAGEIVRYGVVGRHFGGRCRRRRRRRGVPFRRRAYRIPLERSLAVRGVRVSSP